MAKNVANHVARNTLYQSPITPISKNSLLFSDNLLRKVGYEPKPVSSHCLFCGQACSIEIAISCTRTESS